jgi:hypothetical protein
MTDETEIKTFDIIDKLDNKKIKGQVDQIKMINPINELGNNLLEFFVLRLKEINKIEETIEVATEEAKRRIKEDKNVTFPQITNFITNLQQQQALASESVFSLLRPVQNTINPITNLFTRKEDENSGELINNLSSEQMKGIDKLMRLLETYEKADNNEKK